MDKEREIFKKGSTTYYFSSVFFPKGVREDVFRLYSFVRVADDFVDTTPQDKQGFMTLKKAWQTGDVSNCDAQTKLAVNNMKFIEQKYDIPKKWVVAFLDSMQADLTKKQYKTMDETLSYIYGSADVIGLMMSKVMGLPKEAFLYAQMQGRAMQYINFIRDINEDNSLGRLYFPASELKKYGLTSLSKKECFKKPDKFDEFIRAQVAYYDTWQAEANNGFMYIPRRLRIPLRTAVDMYNRTGKIIAKNPQIVFDKKVKPTKVRVVLQAVIRMFNA
jgi:phytoene synthase